MKLPEFLSRSLGALVATTSLATPVRECTPNTMTLGEKNGVTAIMVCLPEGVPSGKLRVVVSGEQGETVIRLPPQGKTDEGYTVFPLKTDKNMRLISVPSFGTDDDMQEAQRVGNYTLFPQGPIVNGDYDDTAKVPLPKRDDGPAVNYQAELIETEPTPTPTPRSPSATPTVTATPRPTATPTPQAVTKTSAPESKVYLPTVQK